MRKNVFVLKVLTVFFVIALFSFASADEKLAPAGSKQGPEIFVQMGHSDNARVAYSPDGRYALSGGDSLKLWEIETGKEIRTLNDVKSAAFSPDGKYAFSVSDDSTARIWEISTGKELATLKDADFGKIEVKNIAVMKSELKPGGAEHFRLSEIPLGRRIR